MPGEEQKNEGLSSFLTHEILGKTQRYDATLANIKEKAYKGGGIYFGDRT